MLCGDSLIYVLLAWITQKPILNEWFPCIHEEWPSCVKINSIGNIAYKLLKFIIYGQSLYGTIKLEMSKIPYNPHICSKIFKICTNVIWNIITVYSTLVCTHHISDINFISLPFVVRISASIIRKLRDWISFAGRRQNTRTREHVWRNLTSSRESFKHAYNMKDCSSCLREKII